MELKNYQKTVLDQLTSYLGHLEEQRNLHKAWKTYWEEQDVQVGQNSAPNYYDTIPGVPHVCMKVPTGGGKTFLACASLKEIFSVMPQEQPRMVVWLVPSDAILEQTVRNLQNPSHPYRQRLNRDFGASVDVFNKEQLLNGQQFSPESVQDSLSVCILSYSSIRIDQTKTDSRKLYQENGQLDKFTKVMDGSTNLPTAAESALIQVIRYCNPVVIVDESHNATSELSIEMLTNLNPSFVLDLTATPKVKSNIIAYVDARALKAEHMVKLPVIVYNQRDNNEVLAKAIRMQNILEEQAKQAQQQTGHYIRPIVLFQAQPKDSKDSQTFDLIKKKLLAMDIPEEQIAIQTSGIHELKGKDLTSPTCTIRYIITVNALKEGWDCPFAYVLASVANKSSVVDVEQTVGRILRQPYTRRYDKQPMLNASYVFTCSDKFQQTLAKVVEGLNHAGFSRKDSLVKSVDTTGQLPVNGSDSPPVVQGELVDLLPQSGDELFPEPSAEPDADPFASSPVPYAPTDLPPQTDDSDADMCQGAEAVVSEYEASIQGSTNTASGEVEEMKNHFSMQPQYQEQAAALRIPQFVLHDAPAFFGDVYDLLHAEDLSSGFSLRNEDAKIEFQNLDTQVYKVDIQEQGEAVPKYMQSSKEESEYFRKSVAHLPMEEQKKTVCNKAISQLSKRIDFLTQADLEGYIKRVVDGLDSDLLAAMEAAMLVYVDQIYKKINNLRQAYCDKQFYAWLDSGKIDCQPYYELPSEITPMTTIDSISNSLYEAEEGKMNQLELEVIGRLAGRPSLLWWHRIIDRKGFYLNGPFNHYPDFMLCTKKGTIVLLETKGDYLDGDDSKQKLKLGRSWMNKAGPNYRYYMVFKGKQPDWDGAYTIEDFLDQIDHL